MSHQVAHHLFTHVFERIRTNLHKAQRFTITRKVVFQRVKLDGISDVLLPYTKIMWPLLNVILHIINYRDVVIAKVYWVGQHVSTGISAQWFLPCVFWSSARSFLKYESDFSQKCCNYVAPHFCWFLCVYTMNI